MSFKVRTDTSGNGQFTIDSTDVLSINTNTTVSLPTGTANGVAYLNGSKVLTSGSALTFDGTNLRTGGITFADASTQNTGGYTGFRNRIINGAMVIDQRNAGASVTNNGTASSFAVDRTSYVTSSTPTGTAQRSTDAPAGFTNSLLVTVNSGALSSIAYGLILQQIEGVNFDDFGWGTSSAQPITMSAWVKASVVGTYSVFFRNAVAFDRYYVSTVTIGAADTWTKVSVSIPGDTSGSWAAGTGAGLQVGFALGVGSGHASAVANTWSAGTQFATSGSVNMYATSGATFKITGWQLEAGSVATPFEFRQYGTELALCQRYYQTVQFLACGYVSTVQDIYSAVNYPVSMRSAPSVSKSSGVFSNATDPGSPSISAASFIAYIRGSAAGIAYGSWVGLLSAEL